MGERTPFAVYVHWPFCAQKCPYCDFNSHVRHGGWDEAAYLAAYLRELDATHARIGPRRTHSVFIGGGTPSLMQPATVGALIAHIDRLWPLEADAEVTIEANPGSVEANRFAGYRASGVNRVSVGVQSLIDADLRVLGRIHSVAEARRAVEIAQRTFTRTSFDLIYARPKQTVAAWEGELREALAMAGSHLSLYQLTIEPQTTFERLHMAGKLVVPDGETSLALYEVTQAMTEAAGLPAYEVSNHARPGEESRHNLVYWRYGEYAGVGPGAHGRIDVDGARFATVTERSPEAWLKRIAVNGAAVIENDAVDPREQADEMLLMGMRLTEGFDLARLAARGFAINAGTIDHMRALGLIEPLGNSRIRATPQGRLVLNRLVGELSAAMGAA
jgi:oxygen-independent coproporphyrinogen-3 oxidase